MFILKKDEVHIIIPCSDPEDLHNIQKAIIATLQQCTEAAPIPLNGVHAFHMLTLLESMLPSLDQLEMIMKKTPKSLPPSLENDKELVA